MELKVVVPSRMEEISLEQYQRFLRECGDETLSEEMIALKMLEIFCGVPPAKAYTYKMSDVYNICDKINKALNEKPPLISRWKYKDLELGFIPKLDDMTFGEFVDVDTYITDWDEMHKAMAVLYRPVKQQFKGSYEIEDYKSDTYWDLMKQMPLSLVMGCMLFFWSLEKDLLQVMKTSSNPQAKQIFQERLTSILNTDGITPSGVYQEKT